MKKLTKLMWFVVGKHNSQLGVTTITTTTTTKTAHIFKHAVIALTVYFSNVVWDGLCVSLQVK